MAPQNTPQNSKSIGNLAKELINNKQKTPIIHYKPTPDHFKDGNSSEVNYLLKRGVIHLCHFTQTINLKSILQHGIMPVDALNKNHIKFAKNDYIRLDGNPDAISTSVSFPNSKTFFSFRCELVKRSNNPIDLYKWCVLEIDIRILNHVEYECYVSNASSKECTTCTVSDMFGNSKDEYPEDVQAEIMIFGTIPPSFVNSIQLACNTFNDKEVSQAIAESGLKVPIVFDNRYFYQRPDLSKAQHDKQDYNDH